VISTGETESFIGNLVPTLAYSLGASKIPLLSIDTEKGQLTMSTAIVHERQEIEEMLDSLSEENLNELLNFLHYLLFKQNQTATGPYQVVDQFESLWADYAISEADIAAARQELWANFGRKDV
jgi:hypothetical protein